MQIDVLDADAAHRVCALESSSVGCIQPTPTITCTHILKFVRNDNNNIIASAHINQCIVSHTMV